MGIQAGSHGFPFHGDLCLLTYSYKIKTNVWFYCLISNAHHFAISFSLTALYQWTLTFHITSNKTVDLSALYHVMCLKRAELVLLSSPFYIIRKKIRRLWRCCRKSPTVVDARYCFSGESAVSLIAGTFSVSYEVVYISSYSLVIGSLLLIE